MGSLFNHLSHSPFYYRSLFEAFRQYAIAPNIIGAYDDVFKWVSVSILKGARSFIQVREFAERLYNKKRKERDEDEDDEGDDESDGEEDGSDVY
jgi:hypothetical protein